MKITQHDFPPVYHRRFTVRREALIFQKFLFLDVDLFECPPRILTLLLRFLLFHRLVTSHMSPVSLETERRDGFLGKWGAERRGAVGWMPEEGASLCCHFTSCITGCSTSLPALHHLRRLICLKAPRGEQQSWKRQTWFSCSVFPF